MNNLENVIAKEFGYLISDHGFTVFKKQKKPTSETFWYLDDELGVEIEVDTKEQSVYTIFVRLCGGELPDGYYEVEGKTVRVYIEPVIEHFIDQARELEELRTIRNSNGPIKRQIELLAKATKSVIGFAQVTDLDLIFALDD